MQLLSAVVIELIMCYIVAWTTKTTFYYHHFFSKPSSLLGRLQKLVHFQIRLECKPCGKNQKCKEFLCLSGKHFQILIILPAHSFFCYSIFLSFIYMYIYQETHFTDSNRENKITSQVIYNFCWIISLLHVWQI